MQIAHPYIPLLTLRAWLGRAGLGMRGLTRTPVLFCTDPTPPSPLHSYTVLIILYRLLSMRRLILCSHGPHHKPATRHFGRIPRRTDKIRFGASCNAYLRNSQNKLYQISDLLQYRHTQRLGSQSVLSTLSSPS